MKTLLCGVIILCLGFTSAQVQRPHDCLVRSRHPNGTAALCSDNDDDCPNRKDRCLKLPANDELGSCCAGCRFGEPLKGAWCGGWIHMRCPVGYMCVTEHSIMGWPIRWPEPIGQCCSNGLHDMD